MARRRNVCERVGAKQEADGQYYPVREGSRQGYYRLKRHPVNFYSSEERLGLLRQNSSIMSAERRPQRYLPLKRRRSPTQERRPSMEGAMRGRNSALRQLRLTATSVRPACASWWMTCTPSGRGQDSTRYLSSVHSHNMSSSLFGSVPTASALSARFVERATHNMHMIRNYGQSALHRLPT